MKYSCQNCATCCITTSSQVSYCGTLAECNPTKVPYAEAIGLSIITLFLLASVLIFLYFAFKDRTLGVTQQKDEQAMKDQIKEQPQARVSQKVADKKQNIISMRKQRHLSLNSKVSKKPRSEKKQAKSVNKLSTQTQTQRGLK